MRGVAFVIRTIYNGLIVNASWRAARGGAYR